MPTHEITLDIKKRKGRVPPRVVVRVGDIATQTISAQVTSDGAEYTSSMSSVRLDILHEDGTWARCAASKSGSKVTCTLPNAAVSSHGTCRLAHFVFYSGSTKAESTEGFELVILRNVDVSDATEEAENYDDILTKLWEKWDAYEQQAEKNETARVNAENVRKANEEAREKAEKTRQDNETTRKQNETTRQDNETTRKSQESARVEAEKERAIDFAALMDDAEEAIGNANTAAGNVNTAIGDANTATSNANDAAASANNAASAAQGAASNANDAATYAMSVADNLQSNFAGDEEVAAMKSQIDQLGSMLADATGGFICMEGTIYAPKSKASVSGSTVTLAASCTASGTTINLA